MIMNRFRQYGLWERYAELYPKDDLVYDVNTSDYSKDWFFAQVTRLIIILPLVLNKCYFELTFFFMQLKNNTCDQTIGHQTEGITEPHGQ